MKFFNKNAKKKLIDLAIVKSVTAMSYYLKSRKKYIDSLTIFDFTDNNVNFLSETIYLMGVYDGIVKSIDNKYEILNHKDAINILQTEMASRTEFKGYDVWIEEALKEGDYVQGSYQMYDKRLNLLNILFVAGQLSFIRFTTKDDGGLENDYEFYDFREFREIKERINNMMKSDK